ncbi:protein FAF-like, chloroplastic [Lotus japonicus]|uniref:protein FAF-like, chloroplastic n=1 Tax=Lotus japonicus TaxID=34305 RepID=UPI0025844AFB|nr:protein FAF-like, chloroplastic [Lotus japonicus]
MISSNTSFPPKLDDYIGTESCYDLQNENDNNNVIDVKDKSNAESSSIRKCKEKRVFPPPIPFLARTQNLASHMPWVLKRYTTSEGRLILKEEKVKRHEYFRTHREDGRLILELVPLDDDDYYLEKNEEEELESPTSSHEEVDVDRFEDEEEFDNEENIKASDNNVENENGVVVGGGSGRLKCLNYNSMRSSPSCILIS